jgi:hypothetical protein
MADDSDFKSLRGLYWQERLKGSSSSIDNPWLLYDYYDLGDRSVVLDNSYWDSKTVDWTAVKIDAASTVGSVLGLNSYLQASKAGQVINVANRAIQPASLGYGLYSSYTSKDALPAILSVAALAPGPLGAIASATSLTTDLLGGYHQGYKPYIPSIPRNPY